MLRPGKKEGASMTDAEFKAVMLYKASIAAFKKLVAAGLLSAEEFAVIDTNLAQKYGLSLSVIYR